MAVSSLCSSWDDNNWGNKDMQYFENDDEYEMDEDSDAERREVEEMLYCQIHFEAVNVSGTVVVDEDKGSEYSYVVSDLTKENNLSSIEPTLELSESQTPSRKKKKSKKRKGFKEDNPSELLLKKSKQENELEDDVIRTKKDTKADQDGRTKKEMLTTEKDSRAEEEMKANQDGMTENKDVKISTAKKTKKKNKLVEISSNKKEKKSKIILPATPEILIIEDTPKKSSVKKDLTSKIKNASKKETESAKTKKIKSNKRASVIVIEDAEDTADTVSISDSSNSDSSNCLDRLSFGEEGDMMVNVTDPNDRPDSTEEKQLREILEGLEDCDWKINDLDRLGPSASGSRYYNSASKVKCRNCDERGHMAYVCNKPKKEVSCVLCGNVGHMFRRCPDQLCFKCDQPGHSARECIEKKAWREEKCRRCGMPGHYKEQCPDIWRQYHLTIEPGTLVKCSKTKVGVKHYCCNCGTKGHLGYECRMERMDRFNLPSYPFIAQYDDSKKTPDGKIKSSTKRDYPAVTDVGKVNKCSKDENYNLKETKDAKKRKEPVGIGDKLTGFAKQVKDRLQKNLPKTNSSVDRASMKTYDESDYSRQSNYGSCKNNKRHQNYQSSNFLNNSYESSTARRDAGYQGQRGFYDRYTRTHGPAAYKNNEMMDSNSWNYREPDDFPRTLPSDSHFNNFDSPMFRHYSGRTEYQGDFHEQSRGKLNFSKSKWEPRSPRYDEDSYTDYPPRSWSGKTDGNGVIDLDESLMEQFYEKDLMKKAKRKEQKRLNNAGKMNVSKDGYKTPPPSRNNSFDNGSTGRKSNGNQSEAREASRKVNVSSRGFRMTFTP